MTTQPWGQPPGGTGWNDQPQQGTEWGQQAPARNDSEDFFSGGGRSAKFDQPGASIEGIVVGEPRQRPQTDIDTGEALTWKDGSPRMQLVISLQTDLRDDDEDDGIRNVYIKGSQTDAQRQSSAWAIAQALKAARVRGVHDGDRLAMQFTNQLPPKFRGGQGAKQWRARLIPAAVAAQGSPVQQFAQPPASQFPNGGNPTYAGTTPTGMTPANVVREQVQVDQANPMQAPTQPSPWDHQPQAQPVGAGAPTDLWAQEVEGQGRQVEAPF